jgi:mono/diheme cytochrome c family protein
VKLLPVRVRRIARFAALALFGLLAPAGWAAGPAGPLIWNSTNQSYTLKTGEVSAHFTFTVTNVGDSEVVINDVHPSCGCTVAEFPSTPWRIPARGADHMDVLVDLRGRSGVVTKDIAVLSSNAPGLLTVNVTVPPEATNGMSPAMMDRLWGQKLAATDHQAVFKKTCVNCHLRPAFGKRGAALYTVACGICHEAAHRAAMVPDLHALQTEIEPDYWVNWVTHGKPGTLMPGFSVTEGGPLEDAQIDSLVAFLKTEFPRPMKSPAPAGGKK